MTDSPPLNGQMTTPPGGEEGGGEGQGGQKVGRQMGLREQREAWNQTPYSSFKSGSDVENRGKE